MSNNKERIAEYAKDATGAATGAGLAVAIAAGTSSLLAGLAAAAPIIVGAAVQTLIRRNQARLERWFHELSRQLGTDPDVVRCEIEAKMAEHGGSEVAVAILASVDSLLRAADDAVVPALGALAARYVQSNRRPDAFFRGTVRLLQDIDASELRGLRELVDHLGDAGAEYLHVVLIRRLADNPDAPVELEITAHIDSKSSIGPFYVCAPDNAIRLFHLLKSSELGWDAAAGFANSTSGPAVMRTERSLMHKLRTIVNVS